MKKSRFSDSQIMEVLKRADAGVKVPDLDEVRDYATDWTQYGLGRNHPNAAPSHGCLTLYFWQHRKTGGLPRCFTLSKKRLSLCSKFFNCFWC